MIYINTTKNVDLTNLSALGQYHHFYTYTLDVSIIYVFFSRTKQYNTLNTSFTP